ncbi:MAG: hypothetical protein AVDCRST_MAG35-2500, partial [uncultured Quadrisphaera sp.]
GLGHHLAVRGAGVGPGPGAPQRCRDDGDRRPAGPLAAVGQPQRGRRPDGGATAAVL